MKLLISKKQALLIVSIFVTFILVIGLSYVKFIQPKKLEIVNLQKEIETSQKLLSIYGTKKQVTQQVKYKNITKLKSKVPISPLYEEFIREVEKAELISDSLVTNMELKDEEVNSDNREQMHYENPLEKQDEQKSTVKSEEKEIKLPPGMNKWSVSLVVESPSYEMLEKFIETIESTNRIVVIENINFTNQRGYSLTSNSETITYNISLTAFYMTNIKED